jgi:hypothetical protein
MMKRMRNQRFGCTNSSSRHWIVQAVSFVPLPIYSGEPPPTCIEWEAVLAPGSVWKVCRSKKFISDWNQHLICETQYIFLKSWKTATCFGQSKQPSSVCPQIKYNFTLKLRFISVMPKLHIVMFVTWGQKYKILYFFLFYFCPHGKVMTL